MRSVVEECCWELLRSSWECCCGVVLSCELLRVVVGCVVGCCELMLLLCVCGCC